jgi:hypothetical protein
MKHDEETKMFTQDRRAMRMLTVGTLAGAMICSAGSAASAGGHESFHGVFSETTVGAAAPLHYDIHGSAKMTTSAAGTTVKINVSGLDPTKTYGSHLHNGSCASGGGGHYQHDEGGPTAPPNELWLTTGSSGLVPNRGGVAHGAGSATWQARTSSTPETNALSVVVHQPGGARIACADLS